VPCMMKTVLLALTYVEAVFASHGFSATVSLSSVLGQFSENTICAVSVLSRDQTAVSFPDHHPGTGALEM